MRQGSRHWQKLGGLLLAGFLVRVAYVLGEAAADPTFNLPMLDGAYYQEWARALASGAAGPLAGHPGETASAFYLAPLYPLAWSGFLRLFGEDWALLFYFQELLTLGAAAAVAAVARKAAGDHAGLAAAGLMLAYHPLLFFASRPMGEALAVALLAGALWAHSRVTPLAMGAAGWVIGLAALARPNLLLVPAVWGALAVGERRLRAALLLAAGVILALAPVAARNFAVSRHAVPVSANGGMTLYHGNGPGARGIGWFPAGLAGGGVADQQLRATRLASFQAERDLDPVEADRFWGARAIRTRLEDPAGSAALAARRLGLLVSNAEISLDYAPGLDPAPWRWLAPLPFAALLGLAGAGLWLRGASATGGPTGWGVVVACAAAPFVFYVSSRYRLPLAVALCVPAGAGVAALIDRRAPLGRRAGGLAVAAALVGLSLLLPTGEVAAAAEAGALANRAGAWLRAGEDGRAEADLTRALAIDPDSVPALNGLFRLLAAARRTAEFDPYYRRAVAAHPASETERWTDFVLERVASGQLGLALAAAEQARGAGVALDPELLRKLAAAVGRNQGEHE